MKLFHIAVPKGLKRWRLCLRMDQFLRMLITLLHDEIYVQKSDEYLGKMTKE